MGARGSESSTRTRQGSRGISNCRRRPEESDSPCGACIVDQIEGVAELNASSRARQRHGAQQTESTQRAIPRGGAW